MFIFYKQYNKYKKIIFLKNTNNIAFLKTNLFKGITEIMKSPPKKSCIPLYVDIYNRVPNVVE